MHRVRAVNYRTQKETRRADRLELKKFCRKERKHTPHKESRKTSRVRRKDGPSTPDEVPSGLLSTYYGLLPRRGVA